MNLKAKSQDILKNLQLAATEWLEMLGATTHYKILEAAELLGIGLPDTLSPNNWASQMKKIADRGTIARLKLGRILVRLLSASINLNRRAFEHALNDLINLGKMVE